MLANLGIALTKLIAALLSGSGAMLAEAVHSFADTINEVLLLIGGRRSTKAADEEHPFGYGRARFLYGFVVAIILFTVGGAYSIYDGIQKLQNPEPLAVPWLPIVVILISFVLEGFSLYTARRESLPMKGSGSWISFIRRAKAPELPIVLLENAAAIVGLGFALLGVGLTIITGDPLFDSISTLFIGALLILVALILGIETKSLLIGEGATRENVATIRDAFNDHPSVESLIHMKTLYLGPDELMIAAKVAFPKATRLVEIATAIDALEAEIRAKIPAARVIYIEPDLYHPPGEGNPTTDAIVIKGSD
ncbi:MAG: cation diffusion facilitator family transporter [Pseudolysinimonas sp.]